MHEKPVERFISASLQPIALALYRGNWQSIAQAVMRSSEVSCIVVDLLLKELQGECEQLCSSSRKSILRKSSPEDLQSFNWLSVSHELKQEAPLLIAFLSAAGAPPRPRNIHKGATAESRYPALCTAAAVLLKERCQFMNALQQLVGIILFHGNASKQVSTIQGQYDIVYTPIISSIQTLFCRSNAVLVIYNSVCHPLPH